MSLRRLLLTNPAATIAAMLSPTNGLIEKHANTIIVDEHKPQSRQVKRRLAKIKRKAGAK